MLNVNEHLKETIDVIHSLFLERENSRPQNSAKYYVVYTLLGCGSTFTSLHKKIKEIFKFKGFEGRRDLENGRESLIEDGMLAKILFYHKTDVGKKKKTKVFKGEQYLPVCPKLIYDDIGSRYKLLKSDHDLLEQLNEKWKKNFKEHGFLIKKGILGVYCTAPWLLFSLLNYLSIWKEEERTLFIMTSSTNWCQPPLFSPLVSALDSGLELRVLLDRSRRTEELDLLEKMKQVEVRNLPKEEFITNRLTFAGQEYIVDMQKVLGAESKFSNYVATIYLGMKDIAEQFSASFESLWGRSSPHK